MTIRPLILALALITQACGGEPGGRNTAEETAIPEGRGEETQAARAKTDDYRARGSFSGGESADGRDVYGISWSRQEGFERIEIDIREGKWGDSGSEIPASAPCRFTVSREDFPSRLVVLVSGARMFSAGPPELPPDALIRGFYRIIYLDDAGVMFAFDIESDTEFEVFETRDPGMVVIDVREVPAGSRAGPAKMFSLRSPSWPNGERLGHFQEGLMAAGAREARILRDETGEFCVEEGLYATREEAERRMDLFTGKGTALFIEERGIGDIPRHVSSLPE